MAKPSDGTQPELVPLTEKELDDAKRKLPVLIEELEEMEAEHKEDRAEQAQQRKTLRGHIKALASQITKQGR